jgi:hypothetical protein
VTSASSVRIRSPHGGVSQKAIVHRFAGLWPCRIEGTTVGSDVEGSRCGLFYGTVPTFAWRYRCRGRSNKPVKIASAFRPRIKLASSGIRNRSANRSVETLCTLCKKHEAFSQAGQNVSWAVSPGLDRERKRCFTLLYPDAGRHPHCQEKSYTVGYVKYFYGRRKLDGYYGQLFAPSGLFELRDRVFESRCRHGTLSASCLSI